VHALRVGLIDQLIGGAFHTPHAADPFLYAYQIGAQSWSSVVLNSLVKINKNEVITFERLKISLKSSVGPVGLG
jgi:hypothetical protein